MGNSADTHFGALEDKAGQQFWTPVYLYLPLPRSVGIDLPERFKDLKEISSQASREKFLKYYKKENNEWVPSVNTVPYSERAFLWIILEAAGYDPAQADYKLRKPKPVTLRFTIGPGEGKKAAPLLKLELVSSSGNADIDEAVAYAFRMGAYFNATTEPVTGSFTYRFD